MLAIRVEDADLVFVDLQVRILLLSEVSVRCVEILEHLVIKDFFFFMLLHLQSSSVFTWLDQVNICDIFFLCASIFNDREVLVDTIMVDTEVPDLLKFLVILGECFLKFRILFLCRFKELAIADLYAEIGVVC